MAAASESIGTIHSKSQIVELSATWSIENASSRLDPITEMKSPPIYSDDRTQKWHMWIDSFSWDFYNGYEGTFSGTEHYLDVSMTVESKDVIRAEYMISIVDPRGNKKWFMTCPCSEFTSSTSRGEKTVRDILPLQNLIMYWLSGDTLTLLCELKAIVLDGQTPKDRFNLPDVYLNKLCMMDAKSSTDVILLVEKRELEAHRDLLAAHSSVFDAMFGLGSYIFNKKRVNINDLDYEVAEQMIQFIYTDKAPKLKQMADRLLAAADKYDLKRLKFACEQALSASLAVDNAVVMLALANQHRANNLAAYAKEIITANTADVMLTKDWNDMVAKFSQTMVLSGDEALLSSQERAFETWKQNQNQRKNGGFKSLSPDPEPDPEP